MEALSSARRGSPERVFRTIGCVAVVAGAMLPWASATSAAGTTSVQAPGLVMVAAVVVVVSSLARAPWGVRGVALQLGGLAALLLAYERPGALVASGGFYEAGLTIGAYVTLLGYFALAAGLYEELIGSLRRSR